MLLHFVKFVLQSSIVLLKLLVGQLQSVYLVLEVSESLMLRLGPALPIFLGRLTLHKLAVACLELLVVVKHLVKLRAQPILVLLDPMHFLNCFLYFLLLCVQKALELRLDLLDATRSDLVSILRSRELLSHLLSSFLVTWSNRPCETQFLLKGFLLFDEFFVFAGHEMRLVHSLNFCHRLEQELRLVVGHICVVCEGAHLSLIKDWHVRVGLEQLGLHLQSLVDHLLHAHLLCLAARLLQSSFCNSEAHCIGYLTQGSFSAQ